MADARYDYLVIGAGSAGCVLASRLAERAGNSVWLAEAGPSDRDMLLPVPGALFRNSTTPRFNWSYTTEPEAELRGRRLFWAQGRVLGGSSSINGMIYTRGHPRDYDLWRQDGCEGWGWDDVLPYFRKSEANERGAGDFHGGAGPLKVTRGAPPVAISDMFLAAMRNAGYAVLDDLNASEAEGFGHYDRTIGAGRRSSTSRAFLDRPRPNLIVRTGVDVRRVLIEHGRAIGVEIAHDGGVRRVLAEREVILCCGAVNTPKLMMLSGIGPADHLREHGIQVSVDASGVGRNLQNHLCYRLQYACSEPVTAYRYMHPVRGLGAVLDYALFRRGILAQTSVATGGFFRSEDSLEIPDVQAQMAVGLIGGVGGSAWKRLPRAHGFSVTLNQGRPNSRGDIRLRSADPTAAPVIAPRYLSDIRDLAVLTRAVARMRRMLADSDLARVISAEMQPGPAITDNAQLAADIRQRATNAFHPVGTTRMGGDAESVVDPRLRVRGIAGLRVADAGVMPSLINGNTNAPTIMIAEKAAAMILADNETTHLGVAA